MPKAIVQQSLSAPVLSASRIAELLGWTRQMAYREMEGVPAEEVLIAGQRTKAWPMDRLTTRVLEGLNRQRDMNGYPTLEDFVFNFTRWEPKIPLEQWSERDRHLAAQRRTALARSIQRRNDTTITEAERAALGVEDYEAVFGWRVSSRTWRRLFDRVVSNAGTEADFQRLEIYGDKRPCQKSGPAESDNSSRDDLRSLNEEIDALLESGKCTYETTGQLWVVAIGTFEDLAERTGPPKRAKRRVLDCLWSRMGTRLAKSFDSLRKTFERRLAGKLFDGRREKKGLPKAPAIPEQDKFVMIGKCAFLYGGRAARTIREVRRLGPASGLTTQTFQSIKRKPGRSKYYENRRLVRMISLEVRALRNHILGDEQAATASIRRNWTKVRSMQVVSADDFTFPVLWVAPDPGPDGRPFLTRGQVLLYIDCRSRKILGRSLCPDRNYDGFTIRTLDNFVCQKWGVPQYKLFERGIWQKSRVVKNAAPLPGWQVAHPDGGDRFGWEQLGVHYIHATRARSKPVELVGGLLQVFMEGVRGYCGRDERRDCPETTRRNKLAFEAGRLTIEDGAFLTMNEWETQLDGIIDKYNGEPQEGMLAGLCPDKVFEICWPKDDPPTLASGEHWHLFAHYVSRRKVTVQGIEFRLGGEHFKFGNGNLGLPGEEVLAWLDPSPQYRDLLGVTDLNCRNPRLVERIKETGALAAFEPDNSDYKQALSQVAAHRRRVETTFRVIKAMFKPTFRTAIVPPTVAEVGKTFAQRDQMLVQQRTKERERRATRKKALRYNVAPVLLDDSQSFREGLDLIAEAEREHEAQQRTIPQEPKQ